MLKQTKEEKTVIIVIFSNRVSDNSARVYVAWKWNFWPLAPAQLGEPKISQFLSISFRGKGKSSRPRRSQDGRWKQNDVMSGANINKRNKTST